ncbi:hypothetical protein D3C80_1754130 [compost metagenome]
MLRSYAFFPAVVGRMNRVRPIEAEGGACSEVCAVDQQLLRDAAEVHIGAAHAAAATFASKPAAKRVARTPPEPALMI